MLAMKEGALHVQIEREGSFSKRSTGVSPDSIRQLACVRVSRERWHRCGNHRVLHACIRDSSCRSVKAVNGQEG